TKHAADSATSFGMTRRRRARLLFKQELAGAARSFHDRLDQRDAEFALFKFENAVDGAASRSSHGVFEERGMIAGLQDNARRAFHRLRREESGYVTRQTNFHTGFGERFQNYVCKRGAAGGKTCDRVHVLFIKYNGPAHGVEHATSDFEMIGTRVTPATDRRHAAVNGRRSVRHRSNHRDIIVVTATRSGELLLDESRRHRSRNGHDQRLGGDFGSDLLQHFRNGLRFYCQQNDVSAFYHFAIVGSHCNAELLREGGCSLRMLYSRGDSIRHKESL